VSERAVYLGGGAAPDGAAAAGVLGGGRNPRHGTALPSGLDSMRTCVVSEGERARGELGGGDETAAERSEDVCQLGWAAC
jgi:hypothetical protein